MRVLLSALLLSLFSLPAGAQTLWSRPYEPNQFAIEAIVPDAAEDAGSLSGATFITGTLSLTDNVEFSAELPLARYRPSSSSAAASTAIGNPFLGLGFSSTTIPVLFQLGVRLPAAPSNRAAEIGNAADVGRVPAFRPEELAFSTLFNGRLELGRYSTLRLQTGVEYGTRPAPSPSQNRIQNWRMQYGAQIWREGDRFITGVTYTGRALLSSPGTSQNHAAFSMMGNWNLVQPGFLVGTSLNTLFQRGEFAPFVGLTLSLSYGRF